MVLGLIFLKYISDAFEERRDWLLKESANPQSEYYIKEESVRYQIAEDRDEYIAENIPWVSEESPVGLSASERQTTGNWDVD